MADFDLIPPDYRHALKRRRWFGLFALAMATTLVLLTASYGALALTARGVNDEVEALRETRSDNQRQGRDLARLRQEQASYTAQLQLLEGLRGGTPARRMFGVIDQALAEGSVWFLDWQFKRAGASVEKPPAETSTGYFVVLPRGETNAVQQVWQIETHMTIRGRARDHAALSRFVTALFTQPEIDDVKVLRTAVQDGPTGRTVDFDLAVVVDNRTGR